MSLCFLNGWRTNEQWKRLITFQVSLSFRVVKKFIPKIYEAFEFRPSATPTSLLGYTLITKFQVSCRIWIYQDPISIPTYKIFRWVASLHCRLQTPNFVSCLNSRLCIAPTTKPAPAGLPYSFRYLVFATHNTIALFSLLTGCSPDHHARCLHRGAIILFFQRTIELRILVFGSILLSHHATSRQFFCDGSIYFIRCIYTIRQLSELVKKFSDNF